MYVTAPVAGLKPESVPWLGPLTTIAVSALPLVARRYCALWGRGT